MQLTTSEWLRTLVPLVDDLQQEIAESERYRRLLNALRGLFPCDAAALLRLEGDSLLPLAIDGLSRDTLGRRFKVSEHPRFRMLLEAGRPWRFAPDSDLPDRIKAALAFTDAMIWTPAAIGDDVVAAVRAEFSPAEAVEIALDVTRNAANKIPVSLASDEAIVTDGVELFDMDTDGNLTYGLEPA